jgi:hypothetical protein
VAEPDGPSGQDSGDRDRRPPPSKNRIVLWLLGIGVGGYLVITGLIGILTHR